MTSPDRGSLRQITTAAARACGLCLSLSVAVCLNAEAQEDGGILRLHQAGMEIGRETFRETGRTLETNVTIPMIGMRIASTTERDDLGRAQRIEERIFRLPVDTLVRTYT